MGQIETVYFVVPYRDRAAHLQQFIRAIEKHSVGKYAPVFVIVEQEAGQPFNRGAMLNLGSMQVLAIDAGATIVLHDVDMLPAPTMRYKLGDYDFLHLATAASQFDYKMPYPGYFGGVVVTTPLDMVNVGGYPMEFWGWGGEDDALLARVKKAKLNWGRVNYGRFMSLSHDRTINRDEHKKNVFLLQAIQNGDHKTGGTINDPHQWQLLSLKAESNVVHSLYGLR
jgi:hypothetical protein